MPKILTKDNPEHPVDIMHPTEEDKRKVYTWNDGELIIDSQVHIYNEILTPEHNTVLEEIITWFHDLDQYRSNPEELDVFYTREQLVRFCRARQFDNEKDKIKKMILENLQWRTEQRPHLLRFAGDLQTHAATGKTLLRENRDHWGRPVIVLHNKYNNSQEFEIGAQLTFYTLEYSSYLMANAGPHTPSHHCVFMNLEGFSYLSQPPMDIAKKVGYALSTGYPESLGCVILYAAPWLFRAFYSTLAGLLLDDRTKSKVVFIKEGDKHLEEKMGFLLGPNWRELTGIDQPQPDPTVAPGFDPVRYNEFCLAHDERRFGTRLSAADAAAAIAQHDMELEEAELEAVKPIGGVMTELPSPGQTDGAQSSAEKSQDTTDKVIVTEEKPE